MGFKEFMYGLNSVIKPIFTKNKGISYLILFVTSRCNCRCPFCFNWEKMEKTSERRELNLEEITKIAKSLPNLSYLTLSGGEPTIRKDLPEICEIFYKHSNVKHITIPTNGFLSDKIEEDIRKILQNCPKLFLKICMSLDGIGTEHDKIRGVNGLYDKFTSTLNKLKKIQEDYPRLSFLTNTVFTKENENKILEILDFINIELDVDYSTVVLARGQIRNPEYSKFNIDNYIKFRKEYMRKRIKRVKISNLNAMIQYVLSLTVQQIVIDNYVTKKRKVKCYALKNLIVIDDIGDVFSCEPLYNSGLVGNMRDNDFNLQSILVSDNAKKLRNSIKNKECYCTWENSFQQSIALTPRYYPRLFFTFLKVLFMKIFTSK